MSGHPCRVLQTHTLSKADRVPKGFPDEDLVMALPRSDTFTPLLYLVIATFMFLRGWGEVLRVHRALNCESPEGRMREAESSHVLADFCS